MVVGGYFIQRSCNGKVLPESLYCKLPDFKKKTLVDHRG